jgi:large subunit ribosomal protein L23
MSSNAHQEKLMQVVLGPHLSEKSTALAEGAKQIVFKVRSDATKSDVRQAVEMLFEV